MCRAAGEGGAPPVWMVLLCRCDGTPTLFTPPPSRQFQLEVNGIRERRPVPYKKARPVSTRARRQLAMMPTLPGAAR